MLGRKCTLCGGRLNIHNICTECGLDNNKSEKNYKINQSSCDGQPLTHVHQEPRKYKEKPAPGRQAPQQEMRRQERQQGEPAQAASKIGRIAVVFIILFVIGSAAGLVFGMVEDPSYNSYEEYDDMYDDDIYEDGMPDPYCYVEEDLPEEGEEAEYALGAGEYIVGVHIPAGNYEAEVQDKYDTVQVNDYENGIYLFEYEGKGEANYLDDLRLYDKAHITILAEDNNKITLLTENAQMSDMHGKESPLLDKTYISDKRIWKAGKDFEPGVYDLKVTEGTGPVIMRVYDKEGEEITNRYLYLSAEGQNSYKNLVIPQDAEVSLNEEEEGETAFMKVTLIPSRVIGSIDYMEYYTNDLGGAEE